jgi:hypothetical protein
VVDPKLGSIDETAIAEMLRKELGGGHPSTK